MSNKTDSELITNQNKQLDQQIACKEELESIYLRKIFIGRLSFNTTEETCVAYLSKYGDVSEFFLIRNSGGRSRGFGFVIYATSEMADRFMAARPHVIDSREIEPKRAIPKQDRDNLEVSLNSKKLYVGGIRNQTTSEHDLNEYFANFGNIIDAVLMKTNEGNSRGFGFVEFDDYDPVDKIVLKKSHILKGDTLVIEKAWPKTQMKRFASSTADRSNSGGRYKGVKRVSPPKMSREYDSVTDMSHFGGTNYRFNDSFNGGFSNRSTPYGNNWNQNDGFNNSVFMNRNVRGYEMNGRSYDEYYQLFGAFAGPSSVDFGQNYGSTFNGGPMRRQNRA